jgi:hypothetical protein
VILK